VRIALLVPGGVDRSGTHRVTPCLLCLVERLARRHDLQVFALYQEASPSRYPLLGATVHALNRRWAKLSAVKAVRAEHRAKPFDVIHAWGTPAGVAAAVLGKILSRPVLWHLAGGELVALPAIEYGGRLTARGRLWSRMALRGATRITAASPSIIREAEALGFEAERLILGVDLERWNVKEPRRRDPRAPPRLIQVASINRVKDQGTLLQAMAHLQELFVDYHLYIVGEDTLDGAMEQRAKELFVSDRVTFRGFVPHGELHAMVAQADLMVMSSLHEGGEVVTLEAAVCGVPVVGTRVGHVEAFDPEAAVAVPVGDPAALAEAIAMVLADEDGRFRMAVAAQRWATVHDADATAKRVEEIYQEMLRS
jgi:glycosyltransferase involved in cell wall biosynthesis